MILSDYQGGKDCELINTRIIFGLDMHPVLYMTLNIYKTDLGQYYI